MKNIAKFLAKRIRNTKVGSFTYTITRIGMASIAIGISILLVSYSVLFGFKKTIKEKLFSLNAHIQVSKITLNQSFDESPLQINNEIKDVFAKNDLLDGIFTVTNKAAILKSETDIAGILIKGVDSSFVHANFSQNILEGKPLDFLDDTSENQILISEFLSKKLQNDPEIKYFENLGINIINFCEDSLDSLKPKEKLSTIGKNVFKQLEYIRDFNLFEYERIKNEMRVIKNSPKAVFHCKWILFAIRIHWTDIHFFV